MTAQGQHLWIAFAGMTARATKHWVFVCFIARGDAVASPGCAEGTENVPEEHRAIM